MKHGTSEPLAPHQTSTAASRRRPKLLPSPLRLLAVVDGTERTNRIINYVLAAARAAGTTQIVVLNVQEKREDARLRGYQSFKKDEIDNLMNERGRSVVTSVSQVLQSGGLTASCKVKIGRPVSTILRCAAEERCDVIVVGSVGPETFPRFLRGVAAFAFAWSVPARLAALAPVPVVIVK
jgi:nucleotide-binding universal stress UspA family protein